MFCAADEKLRMIDVIISAKNLESCLFTYAEHTNYYRCVPDIELQS